MAIWQYITTASNLKSFESIDYALLSTKLPEQAESPTLLKRVCKNGTVGTVM